MKVLAGILFAVGLFFLAVLFFGVGFSPLDKAELASRVESLGVVAIAFFVGSATAKYLSRS